MPELEELVEAADLNALLGAVDSLAGQRAWDRLVDLAEMCEEALERGKQLWPIADHIDYRLALDAPGDYAGSVLGPDASRFVLGPLTEVAASSHIWRELAEHLESGVVAAYVAQERVLRGEKLGGDELAHPEVLELPLQLLDYEPTYCLATYRRDAVEVAEPWDPEDPMQTIEPRGGLGRTAEQTAAAELDEPELADALLELVLPWITESNGAARAAVVEGDAAGAASALAVDGFLMGPLTTEEALQRMAWAGASGGAYGRRRGAALGRFLALYTSSLIADLRWPPDWDDLGATLDQLSFYRFDEPDVGEGWILRLVIEDAEQGWAAAISASDLVEEDSGADDDESAGSSS
ncbi:MAG: hypothetical protein ACRDJ0_12460 [Actinomycetota bacterium]